MTEAQSPNPAQLFEDYFGPALFQPWGKKLIGTAGPQVGQTILDLACATGTIARLLSQQMGDSADVHGLDFSPQMLAVARASGEAEGVSVTWAEGSADDMPYGENTFDKVLSQQGLQFFPDRSGAANEIHRVLKPGGKLVATVWQGLDKHPLYALLFGAVAERLDAPFDEVSRPFSMGSAAELRDYVDVAGFSSIDLIEQEMDVAFTQPEKFLQLSTMAAAAAIPAFGQMSSEERTRIAAEINEQLGDRLTEYRDGDILRTASSVNLVIAVK